MLNSLYCFAQVDGDDGTQRSHAAGYGLASRAHDQLAFLLCPASAFQDRVSYNALLVCSASASVVVAQHPNQQPLVSSRSGLMRYFVVAAECPPLQCAVCPVL